ncbi:MAG: adhesin [Pseudomonadales bacterium RIFCSPHIGHO2_02_FULL_60_43]|nr:MAG: adhesin [Pseudomonadales bacterium RIFCSPHIGHO2_02_FULL_60_43]
MTKTKQTWRLAKLPLAVSLASTLAAPAFGVTFNIGEIEGQFDSSLSVGASWSVRGADPDLIGSNNGGDGLSQTTDDSRQNFKRGETFSKIFKGIHDLELKYGDTGVFVRGKYWYDFELKDESRLFKDISDSNRKEGAQASGAQILDAFVYHNYAIADQPGSIRLGKQVVSWGESTFIQNSINSINPVDASAFRRPGAEIKEGLIPVNMFYVAQSLTENLSMEAFYQLEWDQTVVDNCGTFFAQPDIIADGCTDNLAVLSNNPAALAGINNTVTALGRSDLRIQQTGEGVVVERSGDRDARDSGQFGAALRYFSPALDTEFGGYFINYHSRTPAFSAAGPGADVYAIANSAPFTTNPGLQPLRPLLIAGNSNYFLEYPEDIQLYGLSFSTTLPTGTAMAGEVSYRPNAPVLFNTTDILFAGVNPLGGLFGNASLIDGQPGQEVNGYKRKEITQFQTTFTHFFDQVMGASRLTLVGEVGIVHVGGLEKSSDIRYGRDPIFGPGPLPSTGGLNTCSTLNGSTLGTASRENQSKYCEDDGFVTSTAWGYRARAIWDYPDVIAGVNLKPSVSWSHDVDGYGPNGLFTEGAKAVSLGLDADYQNTYTASLAYTDFFGGKYNTSIDRDFVALSFGVNF